MWNYQVIQMEAQHIPPSTNLKRFLVCGCIFLEQSKIFGVEEITTNFKDWYTSLFPATHPSLATINVLSMSISSKGVFIEHKLVQTLTIQKLPLCNIRDLQMVGFCIQPWSTIPHDMHNHKLFPFYNTSWLVIKLHIQFANIWRT